MVIIMMTASTKSIAPSSTCEERSGLQQTGEGK